jgi:predicted nucleic acid-binding protein
MTLSDDQAAVVDTNIWLDWLVFDDPSVASLRQSAMTIYASVQMRAELADVLQRKQFSLTPQDRQRHLVTFDQRTCQRDQPGFSQTRLRCSDRADQKFLELAVQTGARFLLTQDKALLKLARRAAREHQLLILTAPQWATTQTLSATDGPVS